MRRIRQWRPDVIVTEDVNSRGDDPLGHLTNQITLAAVAKAGDQAAYAEQLKLEILNFEPAFERINAPFVKNLQLLGIDASMRMVDPAQYQRRIKSFDFDITTQRYVMRNTPGVELRSYFGSDAAKMDGSLNLAGISDPAVDVLIEKVIGAKRREELTTAARALDRVLRAGHYWVPHWYKASNNVAYWDKFSRPETKPRFDRGILETWWYDASKAAKLTAAAAETPASEGHSEPGGNAQDLTGNLLGKILRIDVDRDDFPADPARNYGLPAGNPFVGVAGDDEITTYREGGEQYPVKIRVLEEQRRDIEKIGKLTVSSISGGAVRIDNLARLNRGFGPSRIARTNRQFSISFTSDVAPGHALDEASNDVRRMIADLRMAPGYSARLQGQLLHDPRQWTGHRHEMARENRLERAPLHQGTDEKLFVVAAPGPGLGISIRQGDVVHVQEGPGRKPRRAADTELRRVEIREMPRVFVVEVVMVVDVRVIERPLRIDDDFLHQSLAEKQLERVVDRRLRHRLPFAIDERQHLFGTQLLQPRQQHLRDAAAANRRRDQDHGHGFSLPADGGEGQAPPAKGRRRTVGVGPAPRPPIARARS